MIIYIFIYICIYVCVYICIYVYMNVEYMNIVGKPTIQISNLLLDRSYHLSKYICI